MFEKILIANRGEIACRIVPHGAPARRRTVAVYSEADAGAPCARPTKPCSGRRPRRARVIR